MFEAQGFVAQGFGEEDLPLLPGENPDLRDPSQLKVPGIGGIREVDRKRSGRARVMRCRRLQLQRVVRPLLVVDLAKAIECALLDRFIPFRRANCLLEGVMHPLMRTVVLRFSRP